MAERRFPAPIILPYEWQTIPITPTPDVVSTAHEDSGVYDPWRTAAATLKAIRTQRVQAYLTNHRENQASQD